MKKPDPYMIDEDCPEWTAEDFAKARPAIEVFPELVAMSLARKAEREAQKKPRKVAISLRVNADTLAAYKASGKGYQTRMAAVLDKHAG